jgi:hypothetical protein
MNTTRLIILFISLGLLTACQQDKPTNSTNEGSTPTDSEGAKQAVLSMHDFVMTKDLSDSLTFNKWTSFFTNDFLWSGSKGLPPIKMGKDGFKGYRAIFKDIKASYDGITIDYVDASCNLAYVSYQFHEVVTVIKTNEVDHEVLISALVTLKKDEAGKWN